MGKGTEALGIFWLARNMESWLHSDGFSAGRDALAPRQAGTPAATLRGGESVDLGRGCFILAAWQTA